MHRAGGADSVGQVRRGDVARDGQMPEKGAFRPGSAVGRANVLVHSKRTHVSGWVVRPEMQDSREHPAVV